MKGKSIALLLLALGCGLVASLGITQVLAKRGDTPPPVDTTPVYVAKAEISMGTLITDEIVKLEEWPKDRIPEGAISRPEDIDGRRARQNIYAGEPLIQPKLLPRGQVGTDSMVPKGFRVVPVPVDISAINGGLVLPGTRCDVQLFMRADPASGVGETVCKTILQDIRVFAVNDVTSTQSVDPKGQDTKSIPTARTVSLLVTPTQAQIVTLASQLGTIRLILRSADDTDQPKSVAVTAHELIGTSGGGDRAKENPGQAEEERFRRWSEEMKKMMKDNAKADPVKPEVEDDRFTMRIRSGAEVNDVLLINNSGVRGLGDEGVWTATGMGPSVSKKAGVDTHELKPADSGLPASTTPSKSSANAVPLPNGPGSAKSLDGPPPSYLSPQSPGG